MVDRRFFGVFSSEEIRKRRTVPPYQASNVPGIKEPTKHCCAISLKLQNKRIDWRSDLGEQTRWRLPLTWFVLCYWVLITVHNSSPVMNILQKIWVSFKMLLQLNGLFHYQSEFKENNPLTTPWQSNNCQSVGKALEFLQHFRQFEQLMEAQKEVYHQSTCRHF